LLVAPLITARSPTNQPTNSAPPVLAPLPPSQQAAADQLLFQLEEDLQQAAREVKEATLQEVAVLQQLEEATERVNLLHLRAMGQDTQQAAITLAAAAGQDEVRCHTVLGLGAIHWCAGGSAWGGEVGEEAGGQ